MTFCAHCGNEATGFAMIDDERYCHGDEDRSPTCYELAQHGSIMNPHARVITIKGDLAYEIFAAAKAAAET